MGPHKDKIPKKIVTDAKARFFKSLNIQLSPINTI